MLFLKNLQIVPLTKQAHFKTNFKYKISSMCKARKLTIPKGKDPRLSNPTVKPAKQKGEQTAQMVS